MDTEFKGVVAITINKINTIENNIAVILIIHVAITLLTFIKHYLILYGIFITLRKFMKTIHRRLFKINRKLYATISNWPKHERGTSPCTLRYRITSQYDICMKNAIHLDYYRNKKTIGIALGEFRIYKMLIEEANMTGCIGQPFKDTLVRDVEQCILIIDNVYKNL